MKWLLLTFLLLCFVLLKSDAVDQVDALRSTLKTLCDYNKDGAFGNCCSTSNNGESVTLDNTGCFLSSIVVSGSGDITKLVFTNKDLTIIPERAFSSLNSLSSLDLSDNSLSSLSADSFNNLAQLFALNLRFNLFSSLPPGVFSSLSNLNVLLLNDNEFTDLHPSLFNNLNSLEVLALYDNYISTLSPDVFAPLKNLDYLDIGDNEISSISSGFPTLTKLRSLYLNSNSLEYLPPNPFSGLSNLVSLSLRENRLSVIPSDIFTGITGLKYLLLNRNSLTYIPESVFSPLGQLAQVDIALNCLNCTKLKHFAFECYEENQTSCPDVLECNKSLIWKGCYKCNSLESDAICETCNSGYKSDGKNGCVPCSSDECCPDETVTPLMIDNCIECNKSRNGCGRCASGYYIDDSSGSCVKCGEHTCCPGNTHNQPSASGCLECSNDKTKCASCPINTTLRSDGKSCVACTSDECCGSGNRGSIGEHCDSCTSDMSECSTCQSGYKLYGWTCVPCKSDECCFRGNNGDVISNCYSCSPDLKSCLGCVIKKKLDENSSCIDCLSDECCPDNTTIPVTSGCTVCSPDQTSCRACKDGYNNSFGICTKISEGGGNGGVSVGLIVGCCVGGFAFIAVIVLIVVLLVWSKKKDGSKGSNERGEIILKDLGVELMGIIGKGVSSTVYKGHWKGKDVAVKIMKSYVVGEIDEKTQKEISVMKTLDNPYVTELYDVQVIEGRLALIMEYLKFQSLDILITEQILPPELKVRYAKDIAIGMAYIHSKGVIHRDLKLENVLVESMDVNSSGPVCKISDFGTARQVDPGSTLSLTWSLTMTTNIGTPLYMAPEILSGEGKYSFSADVYSYGILLCGLWNQKTPYSELKFDGPAHLYAAITEDNVRPGLRADCPKSFKALITSCWRVEPRERPTFKDICLTVFNVDDY